MVDGEENKKMQALKIESKECGKSDSKIKNNRRTIKSRRPAYKTDGKDGLGDEKTDKETLMTISRHL